jgi:hypothetical protein
LQVRQPKRTLSVAAVEGPDQRKERRVLADRQQLPITERPANWGKITAQNPYLSDERV